MIKSYESWDSLNERMFNKNTGKHVFVSPGGKRQKVVFRIINNNEIIVKIIRLNDVISGNKLTETGIAQLIKFFNETPEISRIFGRVDDTFFKSKFIVYKILKDVERIEKINFRVIGREMAPMVSKDVRFISSDEIRVLSSSEWNLVPIADDVDKSAKTDVEGTPTDASGKTEKDAVGTEETKKAKGSKFRYTMRTNGRTYLMEFTEDGSIDCNVLGDGPDGAISYENGKVMWYTDEDNNKSTDWETPTNSPLYMDGEITNKIDKDFFIRMFTDPAYRNKVIAAYEEKHGSSEITAENIKNMLYHSDGTKMFISPEQRVDIGKTYRGVLY